MEIVKNRILEGVHKIKKIDKVEKAIVMIGDTGVGKSTLLSYLAGNDLTVQQVGLKLCLVSPRESRIKIGHEKYSETSLPNEVLIGD